MSDNMIHEPGKFEGEPTYAPVLYDWIMDGSSDDTLYDGDTLVDVFFVDDNPENGKTLRDRFPYIAPDTFAILTWTSENGFFNTVEKTQAEYDALVLEVESAEEDE